MALSGVNGSAALSLVGVPRERKVLEFRVGLTPSSCSEFISRGHKVLVETGAGVGSGFSDKEYLAAGCDIASSIAEVYQKADLIIKVKEPVPEEYGLIREGQVLFTYFHFASNLPLVQAMIKARAICIAYETVKLPDNSLPLLIPMSEIAGRMAIQEAAKYLEKPMGGEGILLGGVPGVQRGKVLILGGGIVGRNAAIVACGMGADTTVMDINPQALRDLESNMPKNCRTLFSSRSNILEELRSADVVIGAVLIAGQATPTLIYREDLEMMKQGSVIIDVAVDQGGCVATCKPTTHKDPTYVVNGVLHYCVANMPGAVPRTSTMALNAATLKYGLQLASSGWKTACKKNNALEKGLSIVQGHVTCKGTAATFGLPLAETNLD